MNNSDTQFPIPRVLQPEKSRCYRIEIPDDLEHIRIFFTLIYQLTFWFTWDRDAAHSGKLLAKRWLKAYQTIAPCFPDTQEGCCSEGETELIRQNPDKPCLIESSSDGVHWCTIADISKCVAPPGQPGGGAPQPAPGGGQACYHINNSGNFQTNVPTTVNTGDVLTFSNLSGAANDGATLRWDCPDGKYFFAGACQPATEAMVGGDPLPTVPHMSLIAQIAGIWYSCLTPITVPGGVIAAPVIVQLNDATIGDNQGQYAFDVCVANNQSIEVCKTADFKVGTFTWIPYNGTTPAEANWAGGTGFTSKDIEEPSGGFQRATNIYLVLPGVDITSIDVLFDLTKGTYDLPIQDAVAIVVNSTLVYSQENSLAVSGMGQHAPWTGLMNATAILISISASNRASALYDGACGIPKVVVCYKGATPPF